MSPTIGAPPRKAEPYVTAAFVSLFIQNFLAFSGFNAYSVVPDYLAGLGASKTYIGLFVNLPALALVVLVVPLSRYADAIGRKRLILAGYAAVLATSAASFFFAPDLVALLLLRAFGTLFFCAVFTIQTTEAFGLIPRARRVSGMAIYGISGLLSNPVAAFLSERLLAGPGGRWIFLAAFGFHAAGVALALAYRFHEPGKAAESVRMLGLMGRRSLAPLFVLTFLLGGAWAVLSTFLANLSRERLGEVNISLCFVSFSAVAVLIRATLGSAMERRSARSLVAGSYALIAAAFLLSFGLRSSALLVPIGVLYGTGHSVLFPLLSTLFVNAGHDGERLSLNNLFSAANTLGGIVTAVVMGAAADLFGIGAIFLAMVFLCAAMIPVGWFGLTSPKSA